MLKQPPQESRGVNDLFMEAERKRIDRLNEVIGDLELTPDEERALIWLCGLDDWTINNVISVLKKIKDI